MAAAAAAAGPAPRILLLSSWALLLLLAALLHSAAPEKEVPSRPLRVRGRPSSADRAFVRWRPPHSSGSRSLRRYPGYLLGYGESSRKMSYKPLPKEERSHEVKRLEEDELEETKDIAVRVMSSQSVLVTWTDPIYEKQKKPVSSRQYTVRYREKGESARWDYKQIPNRRVLVDKLIPDTMYEFAVRISQGEREGKWSASVYQRTPEAAPTAAPENLNVWPIKGKTATVAATWDALPESEGKVKEYILSYAPALKPFGAKSISYPGDTTSALVEDLQPGERYIFKIRAANRRGQGPQSKAFSVAMPATNIGESSIDQQTNIEADLEPKASKNSAPSSSVHTSSASSPSSSSKQTLGHSSTFLGGRDSKSSASDLKNKLLAGSRVPTKSQVSSRKGAELETDSLSREDTADHNPPKEAARVQPQNQDVKSSVKSHSPVKPPHSVISSGKTPHRSRTPVRTGQASTDKHRSSPTSLSPQPSLSSIPNYPKIETKNLRQSSSKLPSSHEVTLDNLPVDNESNDQVDSSEEKPKPPEVKHSVSHSNQQPSGSRKVVQNHPTKPFLPSVSSAASNSQSHSHHSSYKLVPPDTSDAFDADKSKETKKREQRPGSRLSSPQGSSSASVQTRPLLHSNRHVPRDPRVSAVAAAATHTLPHSHSSSAKRKAEGKEGSDVNTGENDEGEDEENRRRPSSRFSSRSSSSLSASERFNLFKYRSALTANRFANKGSNIYGTRTPPLKSPSTTQSSKVQPQPSLRLASGSNHRSNSNKDKELEDEDESPLPSTLPNAYSPSFSKQSSSVDYTKRRSSLAEPKNHHRVIQENYSKEREATDIDSSLKVQHSDAVSSVSSQSPSLSRTNHHSGVSSQLTNGHSSRSRGSSPSSDSLLRTSMEKSVPLQPPASKYQPDHLESKDTPPKSKQASPLSKKPLMGRSHALSRKTLHPETSYSSKASTDQTQHSRSHLTLSSHQSNEKLEDRDDDSLEANYYKEASDKEEQKGSYSIPAKEVSPSRRISQGRTSSLSKHSESQTSKSGQRSSTQRESLTSSRGLGLSPGKHTGSKIIASSEDTSDAYKLPASPHQSKSVQPASTSNRDLDKDHHYSRETSLFSKSSSTSLRQTHPSVPRYPSGSRVPTRTGSQTDKKYGLLQPAPTKVELSPKMSSSKTHQLINSDDDYEDYDQSEMEENPTSPAAKWPSSSVSGGSQSLNNNVAGDKSKSPSPALPPKAKFAEEEVYKQDEEEEQEQPTSKTSNTALSRSTALTSRSSQSSNKLNTLPKVNLASPRSSGSTSGSSQLHPSHSASPTHSSSSVSSNQRTQNSRLSNPSQRQQLRLPNRQGNGGRPNLTTKPDQNNKVVPGTNGKRNGQKIINGPQGIKWIVDLDRGLVLNVEGRYLQDSQGKPLRVKLGGDGRTIVDSKGAPVVSPDGLPLFGHGRFSKPVANAQDKPIISLGGKPLIGLEMVKKTTTPSTTTTTVRTTTATTTTTPEPTTPEPTTTEPPTEKPQPTCPPGTYAEYDEEGNIVLGFDGLPECNSEDTFSGLDADVAGTTESYVIYDGDYELFETTLAPTTTTTTAATTTTEALPEFSVVGSDPLLEYDAAGKRRFTAPYVTYLNKDPAAPCSLTEALEHFQVESLAELIPSDLKGIEMRPQNAPHNITIVAVEGCHSFVIVDWAKPTQGDLVTGYLVYSASYDDFIRNKWSTKTAGSTNLPIENLKPNTRYYFRVQAKNPYGYGPISSSISYITESDNPLLIVRPPGGEPIWIPFSFKYDPTYSECSGKQYVKRTWYRKFVGVVLCNSLRYKIYLSDDLRDTFYSIGDSWGRGEDHCQFVDSHLDGRTGPQSYVEALPPIQGYYRQYRQEPVSFGRIGYMTPYYYVGWYECGVPIPGKW
uniref:Fibronectin type III domain containing 1 n=1 Tax=Podarcis muralis TaxID=64176 RepID=A0A670HMH7_PODMU|nr:fibronectin type III domain-containing protein 1 [Podarcis muralis]